MVEKEETKVEPVVEETPKRVPKKVELSPEQIASRQLAHDIKVAKFLAGGEF